MQETIAVIFDFDDTLAPDSTSGYLEKYGIDVTNFWKTEVQQLIDEDWDPIPAYLFKMLDKSKNNEIPITKKDLSDWGRELKLYQGVEPIFDLLKEHVNKVNPRVKLEFYLVSSGIGDILRSTSIARHFNDIWACDFAFDKNGHAIFPKKIVSFTDKTRFIFHVQKGIFGPNFKGKPFEVNKKIPKSKIRVPLNQMVVIGDGYTDIPCFSLIRSSGGIAIGVYDKNQREKWGKAWGFIEDGRVSNLVPADYGKGGALINSMIMAVESIAKKILLASTTYQG